MGKVVYNACFGGFGLSDAAINLYAKLQGLTLYPEKDGFGSTTWWTKPQSERTAILEGDEWYSASQEQRSASNEAHSAATLYGRDISRTDPILVQVVEILGEAANGPFAKLCVAEIPSGARYRIDEYDGRESVETVDSYDWEIMP